MRLFVWFIVIVLFAVTALIGLFLSELRSAGLAGRGDLPPKQLIDVLLGLFPLALLLLPLCVRAITRGQTARFATVAAWMSSAILALLGFAIAAYVTGDVSEDVKLFGGFAGVWAVVGIFWAACVHSLKR